MLGARLWEQPEDYAGAWNFGPEGQSQLPVKEVVTRLIALWGHGSWKDLSDPSAHHEAHLLTLCCDKAHGELGWRGVLTIDECLAMTAAWYKAYYSGAGSGDMYSFCFEQIRQYEEKAAGTSCGCARE